MLRPVVWQWGRLYNNTRYRIEEKDRIIGMRVGEKAGSALDILNGKSLWRPYQ